MTGTRAEKQWETRESVREFWRDATRFDLTKQATRAVCVEPRFTTMNGDTAMSEQLVEKATDDKGIWPVHSKLPFISRICLILINSSVEVRLVQRTSTPFDSIRRLIHQHLAENYESLFMPSILSGWETSSTLRNSVERIAVSESGKLRVTVSHDWTQRCFKVCPYQCLPIERCSLKIHVYQPTENSTYERMSMNPSDTNEEYTAGIISELPSKELEGIWESLFYDGDVKTRLLNYIYTTISFSDLDVDCEHAYILYSKLRLSLAL